MPEGLEPVEHIFDAVAPREGDFTASTTPPLVLIVDISIVQNLLENYKAKKLHETRAITCD